MKLFFLILISGLWLAPAQAQLSVNLKVDRRQYLANEPVSVVVTITNRSGQEVFLRTVPQGGLVQSWLDFEVRDGRGRTLSKRRDPQFRAARIPAGQSVSKRMVLNSIFGVDQSERYVVSALIRQPETKRAYRSNSGHFTVLDGRTLHQATFGAPGSKWPEREYRVISFNDGQRTSLYYAVHDARTKAALVTRRLSEALLFHKPQAAIDGKTRLHVLYLAAPEAYVHAVMNRDGEIVSTQYLKRNASGQPRFVSFADGSVVVQGGIPFDPSAENKKREVARKISDRR